MPFTIQMGPIMAVPTHDMHTSSMKTHTPSILQFFSIPPSEVDAIDPQQRLLLETVYESLSSAGLKIEDLRGSPTAVYVGMMQRDFLDHQNYDLDALNIYAATGTSASILSNRVSYVFDWHGPSMTFDTACSSSLVAVHHAIQQLRTGSSNVAVAAGSNLILGPVPFISASKLNMFSPTGRSRMWDAAADGYARGEGVAAVVLKTLSQAIADGDRIECHDSRERYQSGWEDSGHHDAEPCSTGGAYSPGLQEGWSRYIKARRPVSVLRSPRNRHPGRGSSGSTSYLFCFLWAKTSCRR